MTAPLKMTKKVRTAAKSLAVCYGVYLETVAEIDALGFDTDKLFANDHDLARTMVIWSRMLFDAQIAMGIELVSRETLSRHHAEACASSPTFAAIAPLEI